MRFTIERLRTLVLLAGVLLVIALGVFLSVGRFRNRFIGRDIPKKLGLNIQEQADGLVVSHEVRGHMQYKIHASKQVQLKQDGKVMLQLHDVQIELYADDGSRVDRIVGNEFDYDPNSGVAKALGPVEITLMKPTVAPAIAPKASTNQAIAANPNKNSLTSAAQAASGGEIHVKTSGLIFDRDSGVASTDQRVEFTLAQGTGSATGANFDAHQGILVLNNAVELNVQRGAEPEPVKLNAQHAVFMRDDQICELTHAAMRYKGDQSNAEAAKVYFRDDGSAERVDASGGFTLTTATGGRLAAPAGTLEFDEHNQPRHGHLQGGTTIDSENKGRKVHGTSPTMDLAFAGQGLLRSAHLERGVEMVTDEDVASVNGSLHARRTWSSPVQDVAFKSSGKSRVEPASMHGTGGVVITGSSQRGNGPVTSQKMTADDVTGDFGPNGSLTTMTGRGHATVAETTATGTQQTTSGDLLVAHLGNAEAAGASGKGAPGGGMQIESATVDGNVVLTQQPAAKAGSAANTMRATAGHADYDGVGQWLHLTRNPWVTDGALEMSADRLNVSQGTGDAFAVGNVKATWSGKPAGNASSVSKGSGAMGAELGAQGPTHAVAQEAELQRSGLATFKGNARLWQQGNSVIAPTIVLDRSRQTLLAQTTSAKNPVEVVLVSATAMVPGKAGASKQSGPSVIRVHGGDLKYSSAERKAVMRSGAAGDVVATTTDSTTQSNEVELLLLPPGNHAGKDGAAAQVDRMTSTGHVEISSEGRRGTGEKLVYTGDTGDYTLTGTAAAPPKLTDRARGTVTGPALIFNSRDDSVRVDGDGRRTTTTTTAPK